MDRGETLGDIRLESYSTALLEVFADDADTLEWLVIFGRRRRESLEPKIPALGDLVCDVRGFRNEKRRLARAEEERLRDQQELERVNRERAEMGLGPYGKPREVNVAAAIAARKKPAARTVLTGWTAEQLEDAATKLRAGEPVYLDDVEYERDRRWALVEQMKQEMEGAA